MRLSKLLNTHEATKKPADFYALIDGKITSSKEFTYNLKQKAPAIKEQLIISYLASFTDTKFNETEEEEKGTEALKKLFAFDFYRELGLQRGDDRQKNMVFFQSDSKDDYLMDIVMQGGKKNPNRIRKRKRKKPLSAKAWETKLKNEYGIISQNTSFKFLQDQATKMQELAN